MLLERGEQREQEMDVKICHLCIAVMVLSILLYAKTRGPHFWNQKQNVALLSMYGKFVITNGGNVSK